MDWPKLIEWWKKIKLQIQTNTNISKGGARVRPNQISQAPRGRWAPLSTERWALGSHLSPRKDHGVSRVITGLWIHQNWPTITGQDVSRLTCNYRYVMYQMDSLAWPSRVWQLWLGLGFEKAKASSGQAKATAFRPSRAGTALAGTHAIFRAPPNLKNSPWRRTPFWPFQDPFLPRAWWWAV